MSAGPAMRAAHAELDAEISDTIRFACRSRVLKILFERLGIRDGDPRRALTDSASLAIDFKADSLDLLELTLDLEDEFDVSISDEDAAQIDTVAAIVDWIVRGRSS